MSVSPNVIKLAALSLLCVTASVGCGGQGMMPSQAEQSQLESASPSGITTQSLTQTGYGHRFSRLLQGVDLSAAQEAKLAQLLQQFRQSHPPGSAFDPQALRALHQQMLAVLTPQQQAVVQQNIQRLHNGTMGRFARLNLTDQQRTQIRQLTQQYRQAHPWGSASDPQAREELHQQILNVLTPEQRAQLKPNATSPALP